MSESYFNDVVEAAIAQLQGGEVLLARSSGEATDFVRFNNGLVRQAGSITQCQLTLTLIDGAKQTTGEVRLAIDRHVDDPRITDMLMRLRAQLPFVTADPYIAYSTGSDRTSDQEGGDVLTASDALDAISTAGSGRDMVGIYAAGDSYTGFASSLGQRNWHQRTTFNLDWSFYLEADKAVKNSYAGTDWDHADLERKTTESVSHLDALSRRPVMLEPGSYRSFLAPAAVGEVMDLLAWGAFSLRAQETKQSSLLRMVTEDQRLSDQVTIGEHTAAGVAANIGPMGFTKPGRVELVTNGAHAGTLVSARSGHQYGVANNGANSHEVPESLAMEPGTLQTADALDALGTGIYIGNLWYSNYSDRAACRTTGMTRFATFWVEGGEIVAPIGVMRYDDSIYDLFGSRLVGLTDQTEMMLDAGSYGQRSTGSADLPGALVEQMRFTL